MEFLRDSKNAKEMLPWLNMYLKEQGYPLDWENLCEISQFFHIPIVEDDFGAPDKEEVSEVSAQRLE